MSNWIPKSSKGLRTLVDGLIQFIPEPFIIIDSDSKIVESNLLFQNMTQRSAKEIHGLPYGQALGCKYFDQNIEDCGDTYYCQVCEIKNSIEEHRISRYLASEITNKTIVREIVTDHTSLTKIFKLHLQHIQLEDTTYFMCIFKNLNKADLESEE
jgi:transcriptional regulator of aromatic amino acid metabolism